MLIVGFDWSNIQLSLGKYGQLMNKVLKLEEGMEICHEIGWSEFVNRTQEVRPSESYYV